MRTILFYGDSNTYGFDPRGAFGGRYPADVRWTDRLADTLGPEWKILVNAMNGREIPAGEVSVKRVLDMTGKALFENDCLTFAVMLGTNDLFNVYSGPPAVAVAAKMDRFLERLTGRFPDLPVLLIAPPLIGDSRSADPELRMLHNESRHLSLMYHLIAEKRKLDFASAAEWELPLAFDGVHLTEEANRIFAEKMAEHLSDG